MLLKSTFEAEAEIVRMNIGDNKFDRVFTSPLTRCRRLAEFCGFGYADVDDNLAEMDFGDWEMKSYAEIEEHQLEEYFNDWRHKVTPGGESFEDHQRRVRVFINECIRDGYKSVLCFTHGGTILHAMILAGSIDDERPFDHIPAFGSMVNIEVTEPLI